MIPLAVEVAAAIDRYLRARKSHRLAADPALWLGDRGKGFTYDALHKTLAMRAERAGVVGFHPHMTRHTAAHRWLAKGGSEGGLMAVAGWTRPDMLLRYTKAQASARAAEEALRLNLGDLGLASSTTSRAPAARGGGEQPLQRRSGVTGAVELTPFAGLVCARTRSLKRSHSAETIDPPPRDLPARWGFLSPMLEVMPVCCVGVRTVADP